MALQLSADKSYLACCDERGALRVYRTEDFQEPIIDLPGANVASVSFSSHGQLLAIGLKDGKVDILDLPGSPNPVLIDINTAKRINALAFSPDGNVLAAGSIGGEVKLIDIPERRLRSELDSRLGRVYSLSFGPHQRLLAIGGDDSRAMLVNLLNPSDRRFLAGHVDSVSAVAFSPDGKTLATGSYDQTIMIWDVVSGELRATLLIL